MMAHGPTGKPANTTKFQSRPLLSLFANLPWEIVFTCPEKTKTAHVSRLAVGYRSDVVLQGFNHLNRKE